MPSQVSESSTIGMARSCRSILKPHTMGTPNQAKVIGAATLGGNAREGLVQNEGQPNAGLLQLGLRRGLRCSIIAVRQR